ncbi:uncharacterized protein LOC123006080 [Tribolium madens]|uniref:uncharacterized protein LOC123006080 n=1 Tax=Tribolium madens TaxID=41895 RepID=UPI001CF74B58|nr:uncharacterized protein LOC123006080 [Tribolium madens]
MSGQKPALKNAIAQILSCALQPHSDIQRLTEERKKALEMTEDYPFILLEIIQSKEEAYAEKLMAATFLKNYIADSYGAKEFVALNPNLRQKLSLTLIELLSHENDVIRQMVLSSLELLVVNEYPNLFSVINNKVMSYLLSENMLEVTGAIQFMRGLGCNQRVFCSENMYFPPEYIEPLLNVLHNENFPMDLRAATISCMVQILISCKKTPLFSATNSRLTEVFQKLLSEPYSRSNDFKLRGEIINQISHAVVNLSDNVLELVTRCLPAIGQIMFNCCLEFKEIIMGHKQVPRDAHEAEPENFNQLILNILILINNIFVLPNYSSLLTDGLNDFMYLLFILMCAYDNVEETLFTEDNLDISPEIDYTLRGRCGHTLLVFMDRCDYSKFCASFHHVLQKHIAEANLARVNSEVYYNRILEVLMFGVGLLSYVFEEPEQSFLYYIEHWSNLLLDQRPDWTVLGRLLWVGSKFSTHLTPVTLSRHLNAILANYNSQNSALRIACLDAIRAHLSTLKSNPHRMVFSNLLTEITECLFSISVFSPTMSVLCLEAMAYFFEFSPESAARTSQRIMQVILDSLYSHISNASVIREVKFLLSKIVVNSSCKDIVQSSFIPFTIKLIYKSCPSPLSLKVDVPERGFDLLNTVVKFYPETIDDNVVVQGFLAACNCILDFNESSIMEVATIFISNILMKASFQIKTLRDIKGKLLAEYVPDVLFKLLEPYPQEAVCPSKFGRLCVISIMTLPEQIQPCIESILKALLSALQRTNCRDPIKSYCFIFAYMFMWQTESIVNFLSGIPGPDGCSALSYFLNRWQINMLHCEKFEKSIITLALCKMIEYSFTQKDDRINECRIQLESPFDGECSGLEKLYLCLIKILLSEVDGDCKYYQETDEVINDVLVKNHPVCDLNLVEHIKSFIRSYNTHHYYNVVKKFIQKSEENVLHQLEKNGIKPTSL